MISSLLHTSASNGERELVASATPPETRWVRETSAINVEGTLVETLFLGLPSRLEYFTECIKNKVVVSTTPPETRWVPFTILRFGDGEFSNMEFTVGRNCDDCEYYKEQGIDLIDAYYYALLSPDTFLTKWHTQLYNIQLFIESKVGRNQNFININSVTHIYPFDPLLVSFIKTIRDSDRPKLYISNSENILHIAPILGTNFTLEVPSKNAYLRKNSIISNALTILKGCESSLIVLVSAGMFSKILITELKKQFQDITYIDLGSSFDGIYKCSRDFNNFMDYRKLISLLYSETLC